MSQPYPDPAEPILAQRGYSTWAMLPSFMVCAVLSVLFLLSGRLFQGIRGLGEETGSWVFFWITGLFWLVQLLRGLYRGACYTYVLTAQHLWIDRGFRWRPTPPVLLAEVQAVRWGLHQLSRPFHVGWVELTTRAGRSEVIRGVFHPEEFVHQLELRRARLPEVVGVPPELASPSPTSAGAAHP